MKKQQKERPSEREEQERVRPDPEVTRKGEEIEDELDKLDELIDEALGEDEEEAEKQAQEFVDQFKQEGGQ
ncbi:ubiquitin [Acidobacteriota bacterium]